MNHPNVKTVEVVPSGAALGADIVGLDVKKDINESQSFLRFWTHGTITMCFAFAGKISMTMR